MKKSDTDRKEGRSAILAALLLIGAGIIVYLNSFSGAFIFDDEATILSNPQIKRLWPLAEAFSAPPQSPVRDRPVVNLTLSLNYALGGYRLGGYHAVNLAIHLLAGLFLFGVLRRSFKSTPLREQYGLAATGLALGGALLWLVHPLQTESVTYITQRCESMMGMFYLGGVYCFIRGTESRRGVRWYGGALALVALGMASKATMVTAPLMILIYDRIFISRNWKEVRQKRWGVHLGLALSWSIQAVLIARTSYPDIKTYRIREYAFSQFGVILHYLKLVFWPHPLCLDYGWPVARGLGEIIPGAILVGGLLGATVWALFRSPPLGFAGIWFFLILTPTSSFLPLEDLIFEHRMYLPLAAVVVLVLVGFREVLVRVFPASGGKRKIASLVLLGAAAVGSGIVTMRRNLDYRTAEGMWRDVIETRPRNPRAYNNLGNIFLKEGRAGEAFEYYLAALRLQPDYEAAHYNLANLLAGMGRLEEAVYHYGETLRTNPESVEAHNNLGVTLARQGKTEEALRHYREALKIDPRDPAAYYNLGVTLMREERFEEARGYLKKAIELKPDYEPARRALEMLERQRTEDRVMTESE